MVYIYIYIHPVLTCLFILDTIKYNKVTCKLIELWGGGGICSFYKILKFFTSILKVRWWWFGWMACFRLTSLLDLYYTLIIHYHKFICSTFHFFLIIVELELKCASACALLRGVRINLWRYTISFEKYHKPAIDNVSPSQISKSSQQQRKWGCICQHWLFAF